MTLAFKPMASRVLGDIPAQVVAIWPRFRSGDYLVTLEYAAPIPYHGEVIQRIEAFRTELYQPPAAKSLSIVPGKVSPVLGEVCKPVYGAALQYSAHETHVI